MILKERLLKIESNYTEYKRIHLNEIDKIYLGNQDNKSCRFCKKSEPEVMFNTIAHAIPEFVNNHKLISYFECDTCNSKFARTLETHMGDYMNPQHTFSQVKGKRGVPSYKKGSERSRVDFKNGLKISTYEGDKVNLIFDELNKTVTFKAIRASYVPIAIFKCLSKMALTIMDEDELVNFDKAMEWINEENHDNSAFKISGLKCLYSFTPGPLPHNFTTCILFKRKNNCVDKVPYMLFLLAYGNYTFQIFLPMSSKDKAGETFSMPSIPNPYDFKNDYGYPQYKVLDFSSTEMVRNEETNISLGYESFEDMKIEDEEN